MVRSRPMMMAIATLAIQLMAAPIGHAEDADVGGAISKGAQDTGSAISGGAKNVGSAIQQHAEPIGQSIQQGAQDTGTAIHQKAGETGTYLDHATKDFRDGASNFFHKVGNFFSGNK